MAAYDYINQKTLATTLIYKRDSDSFFAPVPLSHSGFAADGVWYDAGVPNLASIASWFTESAGPTRGSSPFPQPALVLLSAASLTILDESSPGLPMWMLFYLADGCALPSNYQEATAGYTPSSLTWSNGRLSVIYTPDAGSPATAALMLTIDFAHDRVVMDTHV